MSFSKEWRPEDTCIIQGGMGIGVSGWELARTVSMQGQLGVVSGTGIDHLLFRRMQENSSAEALHRACAAFPDQTVVAEFFEYLRASQAKNRRFGTLPFPRLPLEPGSERMLILASFVEVFLAKEGHSGAVGINLLYRIKPFLLPTLFGALLAGVDAVFFGAGIPMEAPQFLSLLCSMKPASLSVKAATVSGEQSVHKISFDPNVIASKQTALLQPAIFAVISPRTWALLTQNEVFSHLRGVVIEDTSAGGHTLREQEIKDDLFKRVLNAGKPFWLAGSQASPEKLKQAQEHGAKGVQLGTAFALSQESGLSRSWKKRILKKIIHNEAITVLDPESSPMRFPLRAFLHEDTLTSPRIFSTRPRLCELGILSEIYEDPKDSSLQFRCPADDPQRYAGKYGNCAYGKNCRCLCEAMFANLGLAQTLENGSLEPPYFTTGEDMMAIKSIVQKFGEEYSAIDVLNFVRAP